VESIRSTRFAPQCGQFGFASSALDCRASKLLLHDAHRYSKIGIVFNLHDPAAM
jgi:hypothetical protein